MITSYIYSSDSESHLEINELNEIQELAQRENKKNDITGYLTFKKDTFIQYIEGPEARIKQLIINLENDKRHHIKKSIFLNEKEKRIFKDWSMKYIEYDELIEIGFHDLLETVFFTVGNKIFEEEEVKTKLDNMLNKIAETKNQNSDY